MRESLQLCVRFGIAKYGLQKMSQWGYILSACVQHFPSNVRLVWLRDIALMCKCSLYFRFVELHFWHVNHVRHFSCMLCMNAKVMYTKIIWRATVSGEWWLDGLTTPWQNTYWQWKHEHLKLVHRVLCQNNISLSIVIPSPTTITSPLNLSLNILCHLNTNRNNALIYTDMVCYVLFSPLEN